MNIPEYFRESICCPKCHSNLHTKSERNPASELMMCENCTTSYPIVVGCPILIDENSSVFRHDEVISQFLDNVSSSADKKNWKEKVLRGIVSFTPTIYSKKRLLDIGNIFARQIENTNKSEIRVVALGNGTGGLIANQIKAIDRVLLVETDVYVSNGRQFVSDVHALPIKSCSADVVLLEGVLEHVVDPSRTVEEIRRILVDDGLVLVTLPFLLGVHMPVADFTRFSRLGLIRLFKKFRMVECKPIEGSLVALAYQLSYVFMLIASFGRPGRIGSLLVSAAKYFGNYFIFWLKYIDPIFRNLPISQDSASSFYYIGHKSADEMTDVEINALFDGEGLCPK